MKLGVCTPRLLVPRAPRKDNRHTFAPRRLACARGRTFTSGKQVFNKIKKVSSIPVGSGESAGTGIKNDQLRVNLGSVDGTAAAGLERLVPLEALVLKTTSWTVKNSDHGKHFVTNDVASLVATLPAVGAANKGVRVRFSIKVLPTSGVGFSISPAAADYIYGNGLTSVDNKDAILAAATDRIGDSLELQSDGVDGWQIINVSGTWSKEA